MTISPDGSNFVIQAVVAGIITSILLISLFNAFSKDVTRIIFIISMSAIFAVYMMAIFVPLIF